MSGQIVDQVPPQVLPGELRAIDDQGHLYVGSGKSAMAAVSVLKTKH